MSRCACQLPAAGEVGIVGPAISVLDADISAAPAGQPGQPGRGAPAQRSAAEAKRAAQQAASAHEARSMLGAGLLCSHCTLLTCHIPACRAMPCSAIPGTLPARQAHRHLSACSKRVTCALKWTS
jgi:hypothetical protein